MEREDIEERDAHRAAHLMVELHGRELATTRAQLRVCELELVGALAAAETWRRIAATVCELTGIPA